MEKAITLSFLRRPRPARRAEAGAGPPAAAAQHPAAAAAGAAPLGRRRRCSAHHDSLVQPAWSSRQDWRQVTDSRRRLRDSENGRPRTSQNSIRWSAGRPRLDRADPLQRDRAGRRPPAAPRCAPRSATRHRARHRRLRMSHGASTPPARRPQVRDEQVQTGDLVAIIRTSAGSAARQSHHDRQRLAAIERVRR